MGLLVDGTWQDRWYDTDLAAGGSSAGSAMARLDHARRCPARRAKGGFKAEPGPLPSLCFACLPLGAPDADLARAEEAWRHHRSLGRPPLMGENGWTFLPGPGAPATRSTGSTSCTRSTRQADPGYSGRVTVPVLWDKRTGDDRHQQSSEIIRMLNSAFDALGRCRADFYPAALRGEIDASTRWSTPSQQRRLSRRLRHHARRLRGGVRRCSRRSTRWRTAGRPALSGRRSHHRGRLAAVHHAGALRPGLCRPFQMQSEADRRLSEPVELPARPLPGAGRRRDGEPASHQGALLRQPRRRSTRPDRARGAGNRTLTSC